MDQKRLKAIKKSQINVAKFMASNRKQLSILQKNLLRHMTQLLVNHEM